MTVFVVQGNQAFGFISSPSLQFNVGRLKLVLRLCKRPIQKWEWNDRSQKFRWRNQSGGGVNGRFPLFVYHCSFSCFLQLNRIWNWGRGFYWHGRGGIVSLDVASNAIRSQYNRIPGRPAMICWNKTVEIGASGWYTLRQFPFLFVSV